MQLRQSERKQAKIKIGLQGCSGSGKTYSSLLLAKGLTNGDFTKVAIIDTENGSADLYAHLGEYNVLSLAPPFTPENYIKAIDICANAGMEVIILDSISHCWDELLDFHSKLAGNSFTNWAKVTPRQKAFVDKILQANAHIIVTMRTKQDYVLNQKDGKFIPEKVGLKSVQRDGLDYEFTLVFDVDIKHFTVSSKDRTGLFMGKPEFIISDKTGKEILDWCNTGIEIQPSSQTSSASRVNGIIESSEQQFQATEEEVYNAIRDCNSIAELLSLYKQFPQYHISLKPDFEARKSILIHLPNQNFSKNGQSKFQ
ncbi:AAA family ATPase [Epilithonimonas xixisoli]|uniref:AAA domain-containing protein n=1 Tax=Epilithonimonas xixisoli TaxID=1476462 RepID=A0A4R8IFM6_9FLAO|nr:AAA family ATPase [Epilithonimonas xixisoli]TDX84608.1 AAA domain-containing protein [Epilithonimonas xixisoli]